MNLAEIKIVHDTSGSEGDVFISMGLDNTDNKALDAFVEKTEKLSAEVLEKFEAAGGEGNTTFFRSHILVEMLKTFTKEEILFLALNDFEECISAAATEKLLNTMLGEEKDV